MLYLALRSRLMVLFVIVQRVWSLKQLSNVRVSERSDVQDRILSPVELYTYVAS